MLDLGVTPDRIIYANPSKKLSNLKYAVEMGVETMTFDCDAELLKIQKECPSARYICLTSGVLVVWGGGL